MSKTYSAFDLLREGLRDQKGWGSAWRSPMPRASYDVIIVGDGGHGLAAAYYLAKNQGVTNVESSKKAGFTVGIRDAIPR